MKEKINVNYKICTKCGLPKLLTEFTPSKQNKGGLYSWCKRCCNMKSKKYRNKYPWKIVFNGIKHRCNNPKTSNYNRYGGRGIKCLITEGKLKRLWYRDRAFNMKKASIDRVNNDGDYIYSNCRFIEMEKNVARINRIKQRKPIYQYTLQGKFIKEWKSGTEIEKTLGFYSGNISHACRGKLKTAYGFIWKFINER